MAFSDDDIKTHMRGLRAPTGRRINLTNASTYAYESLDGPRDEHGDGIESWRQKLRRENEERFTLKGVHRLKWK